MQRVGSTLLFERFDLEEQNDNDRAIIGHRFEDLCSADSPTSFRAILKSQLGSHTILLRCEVDAHIPSEASVAAQLASINLDSTRSPTSTHDNEGSTVTVEGNSTRSQSLYSVAEFVELKSKTANWESRKQSDMTRDWPQVFFGGVPKVFIGIKHQGFVERIIAVSSDEMLATSKLSDNVDEALTRLCSLLQWIKDNTADSGQYSLYLDPLNPSKDLRLFKYESTKAFLPAYWQNRIEKNEVIKE